MGNSHVFVLCMLYWIHLVVRENSVLCYFACLVLQKYCFDIHSIRQLETNTTFKNIWAIHTSLYRVCCIEYTWLFVNAKFYAVLCISHSKCIFWDLNNLIARNQHYFRKTYENVYTIFSFTQYEKNLYKCKWIFTWKLSTTNIRYCEIFQQYTQYNGLSELTNREKCIGFFYENYP